MLNTKTLLSKISNLIDVEIKSLQNDTDMNAVQNYKEKLLDTLSLKPDFILTLIANSDVKFLSTNTETILSEAYIKRIKELAVKEGKLDSFSTKRLIKNLYSQPLEILEKIALNNFTYSELHLHTKYSLLDGVANIEEYINKAVELGHPALAVTDHRVTHGLFDLRSSQEKDIKPIFGCEVEVHENGKNHHLVLLAMNRDGLSNILTIVSKMHVEKVGNKKPATSREVIKEYSNGIIALSACIGGILGIKINEEKMPMDALIQEVQWWKETFNNNFYLEVQDYSVSNYSELEERRQKFIDLQNEVNEVIIQLSQLTNTPLIATSDVHYPNKGDDITQDVLLAVGTKKQLNDPSRLRFDSTEHYMKNKWDMLSRFSLNPSAIFNTQKIVESCNVTYQEEYLLPSYPNLPNGKDEMEFFRERTISGLKEFYKKKNNHRPLIKKFKCSKEELWDKIMDRMNYELKVLEDMGFQGYILLVSWINELAKANNILVGPGRGSAAGSIVALGNKITTVCPLRFDLLFERFLNPDRIEMPDIDVDYEYERRSELIEKVQAELGWGYAAQIVTMGKMMARAAIRESGRVLGLELDFVDSVAKMIPFQIEGKAPTIKKALETVSKMKEQYDNDSKTKKLIDIALLLEGRIKNYSVHAAGVILSSEPIYRHVSFQKGKKALLPVVQGEMSTVDGQRLVKQDFLGLRTLSVLRLASEFVYKNHGVYIDPEDVPVDDPKTYAMLARGESIGCFQLESKGMRQLLKDINVALIEDIIDCIALYRPGVLSVGMHDTYVSNKNHPESIEYIHEALRPILEATRGILIYQEQAMHIANQLAGFSMADADKLRKAIGKKKEKLMAKLKKDFIKGCKKYKNISEDKANEIWHLIEVMAKYSFNKSHSVAYAYIALATAYFKANYPIEFMCAAITKAAEAKSPKVPQYLEEAKRLGITVVSPEINLSEVGFSIKEDKIIFGLKAIKDVGKASQVIVEERNKNGDFKNIIDFRKRCPSVNKKVLTALIKVGSFDALGENRNSLIDSIEELINIKPPKNDNKNQISLIPDFDEIYGSPIQFKQMEPPSKEEIAFIEEELCGTYITAHPLSDYKEEFENAVQYLAEDLNDAFEGMSVVMGGLVKEFSPLVTKKGKKPGRPMAKFVIEDLTGSYDTICFPNNYEKIENIENIRERSIVLLKGKVNFKERFNKSNNENESDEDNLSENEEQKDYEVQIVIEDMMIFNPDERQNFIERQQTQTRQYYVQSEQFKQFQNDKTKQNVGIPLSQYLYQKGNPNVLII